MNESITFETIMAVTIDGSEDMQIYSLTNILSLKKIALQRAVYLLAYPIIYLIASIPFNILYVFF